MEKIKTVIVEDNPLNRERLLQLIKGYCPSLEVASVAGTVAEAIACIRSDHPALLFLDVELPDGTGFDVLEFFKPIDFRVVFCTGHMKYAYQAIKFNAVDYLVKPVSIRELVDAVSKFTSDCPDQEYTGKIEAARRQVADPSKIVLHDSSGFSVLEIGEIIMLEADGNYTNLFLTGQRKLTYYRILKEFEGILGVHANFMRVHRSYMVSLDHVRSYSAQGVIRLSDNLTASLGDSFREQFLSRFE